jgi:hypothetical protein
MVRRVFDPDTGNIIMLLSLPIPTGMWWKRCVADPNRPSAYPE